MAEAERQTLLVQNLLCYETAPYDSCLVKAPLLWQLVSARNLDNIKHFYQDLFEYEKLNLEYKLDQGNLADSDTPTIKHKHVIAPDKPYKAQSTWNLLSRQVNKQGFNLLMLASYNSSVEIAEYLMAKGCPLNHANKLNETALSIALVKQNLELIKCLTENSYLASVLINVNLSEQDDCDTEDIGRLQTFLLKLKKAKVYGNCALNYAEQSGNPSLYKLVKQATFKQLQFDPSIYWLKQYKAYGNTRAYKANLKELKSRFATPKHSLKVDKVLDEFVNDAIALRSNDYIDAADVKAWQICGFKRQLKLKTAPEPRLQ